VGAGLMVDVIFRDVDPVTLERLLEVLQGQHVEVHPEPTYDSWNAAIATEVLNESVPRATKLVRAVVEASGEITVEDARRQTGEQQLHHMVQSLTTAARRLSPRYFSNRRGLARPLDPIRQQGNRGRVIGYRMSKDALDAFSKALK